MTKTTLHSRKAPFPRFVTSLIWLFSRYFPEVGVPSTSHAAMQRATRKC
jgi:hypothetical protein